MRALFFSLLFLGLSHIACKNETGKENADQQKQSKPVNVFEELENRKKELEKEYVTDSILIDTFLSIQSQGWKEEKCNLFGYKIQFPYNDCRMKMRWPINKESFENIYDFTCNCACLKKPKFKPSLTNKEYTSLVVFSIESYPQPKQSRSEDMKDVNELINELIEENNKPYIQNYDRTYDEKYGSDFKVINDEKKTKDGFFMRQIKFSKLYFDGTENYLTREYQNRKYIIGKGFLHHLRISSLFANVKDEDVDKFFNSINHDTIPMITGYEFVDK